MRLNLFPKNFDFFLLFEKQGENLLECARILEKLEKDNNLEKNARAMKKVEKKADEITHEIYKTLNKTFITPIEREDIALLASELDTVIDELEHAINRISLYEIDPIPIEVFKYCDIICEALEEVSKGIKELKNDKNRDKILKSCEVVNLLENQADDIHRQTLGKLMNREKDLLKIIKLREIYEALENVTDSCENVANSIETIVIKNN
ncbi:MAG: DUF47 family protein [Candidatus Berkelbacteria bacterium]|nr:DUF47 family protein [Candidatus Berkelbacteria bacterium]